MAGRFAAAWNSLDQGIAQNGYELLSETFAQDINQSDMLGDSILDSIYRGCNFSCIYETYRYAAGTIAAWFPWAALGNLGLPGTLASDAAKALVLTSTAGTPAAAAPASLTATKAILAPGQTRMVLDSRVRTLPIRMRFMPVSNSGTVGFFSLT